MKTLFPDNFYFYDAKCVLIPNWRVKDFAIYEALCEVPIVQNTHVGTLIKVMNLSKVAD